MWKIIICLGMIIMFSSSVNALCWNPLELFCIFSDVEAKETLQTNNIYETNLGEDISVNYNNGILTDGQGRECEFSFSGLTTYSKSIPDGVEIFFEKNIDSLLTLNNAIPKITINCNDKTAFDYLNWDVVKQEYSESTYDEKTAKTTYQVKPQSYDYSIKAIDNYTREYTITLNNKYLTSFNLGDKLVIDPTYSISNITLNTIEQDVTCEGGGYECHLTTNLTESLVLYMPFDVENNTATVYDWSNYNNDGTIIQTPIYNSTGGLNGTGAYQFDGIDLGADGDSISITSSSLNISRNITYGAWVKMRGTGIGGVISRSSGSAANTQYVLAYYNGLVCFRGNGTTSIYDQTSTYVPALNEWHHAMCIINQTAMCLYIDGSLYGNCDNSLYNPDYTAQTATSLGVWGSGSQFLNGSIDEVMIFNRSLSATEISNLYKQQFPKFNNDIGNHTIKPTNIETPVHDRVNVTVNHANQLNSNLSLRIGQINKSIDNMSGLVLYMPFEWNSAKAWDISGNNNDGTLSGVVYNSSGGLNGTGAYQFDGSNDYINILDNSYLDGFTSFTASFWAKTNSYNLASAGILDKYYNTGNQRAWRIVTSAGSELTLSLSSNGSTLEEDTSGLDCGFKENNVWAFFTIDYNGTYINYYRNGVFCDLDATAISSVFNSNVDLRIGNQRITNIYFNGTIDEVMIFNRSLSASEISQLYTNQASKFQNIQYTPYQNMSNNIATTFTISENASFLFPDFDYYSDGYKYSSPILKQNITFETYLAPTGGPANTAPSVPILNAPANNTLFTNNFLNVQMNWSNSTDAEGNAISYYLEIANDTAFSQFLFVNTSIAETTNTTGTKYSFPNETKSYWWRALATDGSLNSTWSIIRNISFYSTPVIAGDTCSCPLSGNWNMLGTDNCHLTTNCNLQNNEFVCSGLGVFYLDANINNYKNYMFINGCSFICGKGCFK